MYISRKKCLIKIQEGDEDYFSAPNWALSTYYSHILSKFCKDIVQIEAKNFKSIRYFKIT